MIIRGLTVTAAAFFVVSTAHAAPGDSLPSAILGCAAQQDAKAQLACYNQIAAQLKAGASAAAQVPVGTAPAPSPSTATDFGKENLPFGADASAAPDRITARVANVAYNFFHIFTVTLDNGQVWRQVDDAAHIARFRNDKTDVVTITRGFLDSFHLAIAGGWGNFTVKRLK
jgi:hypothetical protein